MTIPKNQRRDRGASLVEFAIVLPLFLLLIGGMVDFGRAFYTKVMLTNSAREGACSAMYGTAPGVRATAAAGDLAKSSGFEVKAYLGNDSGSALSSTACAQGATTGTVTVLVQAGFQWTLLAPVMNLADPDVTLTGKATMQCGG